MGFSTASLGLAMSKLNPGTDIAPPLVVECARALEARLGRPTYVRQVKNSNDWFVTDPMFSFVQHGLRKGATGYRVGYFFSAEENELAFYMVHSPVMAQLFKKNIRLSVIAHAVQGCSRFMQQPRLFWSSCSAIKEGKTRFGVQDTTDNFLTMLLTIDERKFISDLFPKLENQKTGVGPAKWAGNDFFLLLAENATSLQSNDITTIVESAWPLFLCLYPVFAIEQRVASLARNLVAGKYPKQCEYSRILDRPSESKISAFCRGEIEGAHIKPHSIGGSDRSENGLWLCQYHHRETEGRLAGSRTKNEVNVRFTTSLDDQQD